MYAINKSAIVGILHATNRMTSLGEAGQTDHNGGDVVAVVPFDLPPLGRRRLDQVLRRLRGVGVWGR